MITLRLEPKLEQRINRAAENLGMTRSELIRQSIKGYLGEIGEQNAWQLGQDLFGQCSSGRGNLSTDRKKLIKDKVRNKRA